MRALCRGSRTSTPLGGVDQDARRSSTRPSRTAAISA